MSKSSGKNGRQPYLYRRGRRWWAGVYVPRRGWVRFACAPDGESMGTTNKDVAALIARRRRDELLAGAPPADPMDMDGLLDKYHQAVTLATSPLNARNSRSLVRRFLDSANIADPAAVTAIAIEDFLAAQAAAGKSPSTLLNYRGQLSTFCKSLIRWGHLPGRNPARGIPLASPERRPPRFLCDAEIQKTLAVARDLGGDLHLAIGLVLVTGLRVSELRRQHWRDVDLDGRRLIVRKIKKRKMPRTVWLNAAAIAILEDLGDRHGRSGYILPGRVQQGASGLRKESWFRDAFKPIQRAVPAFTAGVGPAETGRAWHLLRHTFASLAVQRGVALQKVRDWMGHTTIKMTEIYAHLAPDYDTEIETMYLPAEQAGPPAARPTSAQADQANNNP